MKYYSDDRRNNRKNSRRRGFTLAEVLITVGIIAVLAAVSVPVFHNLLEGRREANDAANIRAQYEKVMAAALAGAQNVNINGDSGAKVFGTIELEQKKDGWQDEELKEQMLRIASRGSESIVGEPVAGGKVWVSYKKNGEVCLNFGGAETDGTNIGGIIGDPDDEISSPETKPPAGSGDTPGDNPGGGENTEPDYKEPGPGDVPINTDKPDSNDNNRPSESYIYRITAPDSVKSSPIKIKLIVHKGNNGNGAIAEEHILIFDKDHMTIDVSINNVNNGSFRVKLLAGKISHADFNALIASITKISGGTSNNKNNN